MNRVKNIVIVNDYANINGGTANVAINSALGLANKGYRVTFMYACGVVDEKLKHENITLVSTNQKDILNKNKIASIIDGIWNIKSYKLMKNILKELENNNTVIHIHGWTKALSSSIFKPIKDLNFECCITSHDYFSLCPNGGLYNYKTNKVCTIKPMSMDCMKCNCDKRNYIQKIWRYIRGIIQKIVLKGININFICISKSNLKLIKDKFNMHNYYYIKNPISINNQGRIKVENNNIYGAIGRISPEKGFDILASATLDKDHMIKIIGDGQSKQEILEINNRINITGWLDRDKVIEEMQNFRACILPSRWYEGMPLVIGEAMSLGIPMIISDICNGKDAIEDRKNGLIFKNESVESLKKSIELLEDDKLLKQLSKNAYESFWKDDNSLEYHCENLLYVYNDIIDKR